MKEEKIINIILTLIIMLAFTVSYGLVFIIICFLCNLVNITFHPVILTIIWSFIVFSCLAMCKAASKADEKLEKLKENK